MRKEPWFVQNPTLFEQIKNSVNSNFPMMVAYIEDDKVFIKGNLQLKDDKHKIIDQYTIEIEIPKNYPKGIPIVRELSNRIPKIANRHVNPDGVLCLFVPDEKWKHYPDGTPIADFIKKIVSPYLLSQSHFEQTGKFLFGERPHGANGILEFYCEILQTKDVDMIKTFITYLSKPRTKGHWLCYCKSGNKLRNCHLSQLIEYRNKIEPQTASGSLGHLIRAGY